MRRKVPVATRHLLAEPRRFFAAALAVGMAVMLILLLDGLWTGVRSQVTRYEDAVGADLYVVAPGARSLFAEGSRIPLGTVEAVEATHGVGWAAPVRGQFAILDLHDRKVATTFVGFEPGRAGGPWSMAEGRPPQTTDEAVLDQVLAERHGLAVGDDVQILGRNFDIVGLSRGTASFMTGFVFVTHDAVNELLRQTDSTTAVLIGTDDPAGVRERLVDVGLEVLDRDDLREAGLALTTRIYGTPVRLMVGVAFAAGTLIIALTAYTLIAEHRREYGIVKAMGATTGWLTRLAVLQSLAVAAFGLAAGFVLFAAGRLVIVTARPQFTVVLTPSIVLRTFIVTAVMALVAAIVPARRLSRLDPASAYRGD